jgi:hypothetical protein
MPENRDKTGRFVKGKSGNPGGRPKIPDELREYAAQAPQRLREIADDPNTPTKVKADIERWFAEMAFGKAGQQMFIDGNLDTTGTMKVEFEGKLKDWAE